MPPRGLTRPQSGCGWARSSCEDYLEKNPGPGSLRGREYPSAGTPQGGGHEGVLTSCLPRQPRGHPTSSRNVRAHQHSHQQEPAGRCGAFHRLLPLRGRLGSPAPGICTQIIPCFIQVSAQRSPPQREEGIFQGLPPVFAPQPHQIPSVPPAQMVSTDHKRPCAVLPIPAAQAVRGPEHQPPYSTHCNMPSPENFLLGFTLQHPLLLLLKERVSITGYDLDGTLP